jgi:hypothetical protein
MRIRRDLKNDTEKETGWAYGSNVTDCDCSGDEANLVSTNRVS